MPCTSKPRKVPVHCQSHLFGMLWGERNGELVPVIISHSDLPSAPLLGIIPSNREAWSVCGKMSTQVAMQMYVEELQQV